MESAIYQLIDGLYRDSPLLRLHGDERIVIMSDFHMGDGSRNDDFAHNAGLVAAALSEYYYKRGYTLVLNGDIEELQRFPLSSIFRRWRTLYRIFDRFAADGRLYKIVGNHDMDLLYRTKSYPYPVHQALRVNNRGNSVFILHGHQSSRFFSHFNWFSGLALRYLANPLGIRNFPVAQENKYRFIAERRFYRYSRLKKIITVIGHTHRPLFESLSKSDSLKMNIENLCRLYPRAGQKRRRAIAAAVERYKAEMKILQAKRRKNGGEDGLYTSGLTIPTLFNSGCAVGRSGTTAIELSGQEISLVHWFDSRVSRRFFAKNGSSPGRLSGTDFYKKTIKKDNVQYIFARINLLS
jgi:UDP-2,3-diacylglucosamine pyrophosphatase LpxH